MPLLLNHISVEDVPTEASPAPRPDDARPSAPTVPLAANPPAKVLRRRRFKACWEGGGRSRSRPRQQVDTTSAETVQDSLSHANTPLTGQPASYKRKAAATPAQSEPKRAKTTSRGRGSGRGRGRGAGRDNLRGPLAPLHFPPPPASETDTENLSSLLAALAACDVNSGVASAVPATHPIPTAFFLRSSAGSSNRSCSLIGKYILYKSRPKGEGGWRIVYITQLVATTTTIDSAQYCCTFMVQFCDGDLLSQLLLYPSCQHDGPEADKGAWWPLHLSAPGDSAPPGVVST